MFQIIRTTPAGQSTVLMLRKHFDGYLPHTLVTTGTTTPQAAAPERARQTRMHRTAPCCFPVLVPVRRGSAPAPHLAREAATLQYSRLYCTVAAPNHPFVSSMLVPHDISRMYDIDELAPDERQEILDFAQNPLCSSKRVIACSRQLPRAERY